MAEGGWPVPVDLSRVRTYPLRERNNKVATSMFARLPEGGSIRNFVDHLPDILIGADFKALVEAIIRARVHGKPLIWGMGAHVIKCGLSSWVIELMRRGIITGVAMNGAGPIHDFEVALIGETSEDVGSGLRDGSFGMARETGQLMNDALDRDEVRAGAMGMGQALARKLVELDPTFGQYSVLLNAHRLEIPVTIHVALGTDIIHMRNNMAGALLGQASYTDFRLFTAMVMELSGGGVYLNVGSSVLLPEVFLKAFTICQNLGADLGDFVTANFDMVQHYRPIQNVVKRPTDVGGRGFAFTGHHELMVPLLGMALIESMPGPVDR